MSGEPSDAGGGREPDAARDDHVASCAPTKTKGPPRLRVAGQSR